MRLPSSFSLCQAKANSLPSGEKAGVALIPTELVKGTILSAAPEIEGLPLVKYSQPIPAARLITTRTATGQSHDFGLRLPAAANDWGAVECAAVVPEVVSRLSRFRSVRNSAALW